MDFLLSAKPDTLTASQYAAAVFVLSYPYIIAYSRHSVKGFLKKILHAGEKTEKTGFQHVKLHKSSFLFFGNMAIYWDFHYENFPLFQKTGKRNVFGMIVMMYI